ncbi:MAG TPA: endonuclease III [Candidatus Binataceae bacterium]|nr:endonuclease III [Candidatus Binataceae bacterium]
MRTREPRAALKERAARVSASLAQLYPAARISLDFETPWQCLAATILSAQCTDERVNRVTPALFREFPDARATARASEARIRELIAATGFFREKTKSLIGAAKVLVERHGGEVPSEMEHLVALRGVGRKTANVVRGHVFGEPGFVVDTHVRRLSRRLGFTRNMEPDKIERDMKAIVPPEEWTAFSMRLILHGRRICIARRPRCDMCAISPDCPKIGVTPPGRKASGEGVRARGRRKGAAI